MILYPDMTAKQYEGSEDFIYAAPLGLEEWEFHLRRTKAQTPEGMSYRKFDAKQTDQPDDLIILLRRDDDTDDECLAAGAWLRIATGFTGRIYVVGCVPQKLTMNQLIVRTAGSPPELVTMFDEPRRRGDKEESQ